MLRGRLRLRAQASTPNATLTTPVTGIGQRSRYQVGQLVGARNSRPAPEVVKVVGTFVEEVNNRARFASTVGAVDQLVLVASPSTCIPQHRVKL